MLYSKMVGKGLSQTYIVIFFFRLLLVMEHTLDVPLGLVPVLPATTGRLHQIGPLEPWRPFYEATNKDNHTHISKNKPSH